MGAATDLIIANLALSAVGARRITTFGETTTAEGREINAVYVSLLDEVLAEHPWNFAQKRVVLAKEITAATQASPVVITSADHGFSDGDEVKITSVKGMTELNGITFTVANKADDTFELTDSDGDNIDGSEYTEYSSGGYITKLADIVMDEDDVEYVYSLPSDYIKVTYFSDTDAIVKFEGSYIYSDTDSLKMKYTYRNVTETEYSPMFVMALATRLAAAICFPLTESRTKAADLLEQYLKVDLPRATATDSQEGTEEELTQDEWETARGI